MNRTDLVDRASLRDDIPDFAPGDTLKVHVRVVEGNRERVQVFQGVVIRRKGEWRPRDVHRPQGQLRRRRRAHVPRPLADHRQDRGRQPRRRPPGEALLPARPGREGGEGQGEARLTLGHGLTADRGGSPSERRGPRAVRDRDRAPALQGVPRRPPDVLVRRRDRASLLSRERGRRWTCSTEDGRTYFELELRDAWVWDMYRPARFVANVRVVTFKDVNIEELAARSCDGDRRPPRGRGARRGARSRGGTRPRLRRRRPQLALPRRRARPRRRAAAASSSAR